MSFRSRGLRNPYGVTLNFPVFFITCLALIACSANKASEVEGLEPNVSINNVYYEISGATAAELRHQLTRFGPTDEQGVQRDAYTAWYVESRYPNSMVDGNCATGAITVTVTITHTYPKWAMLADASQDLVDKWKVYLAALETHEAGHRQIGLEAGDEVLQTLSKLPAYLACNKLEQVASKIGQNILDKFRQKELEYDQATGHGVTEGALFP